MKCFYKIVTLTLILIASLYINIEAQPYQWFEMNGGANDDVREVIFDDYGNMYAGGSFTQIGGIVANTIAMFDGTNWHTVGTGVGANGQIMAIAVNGTDVYVGGEFTEIDGVEANYIAKWDGVQWSAVGTGANSWIYTLDFDDAGNLYAGGNFTTINGVSANYIARWNGTNWSSLNYGTSGTVYDIACEGTDVYIAGSFMRLYNGPDPDEDYVYYRYIGKWNGSEWSKITPGNGANGGCFAIESDGLGNIYIGGFFGEVDGETIQYFAMWDGDEWSTPGDVSFNGGVYDIKAHFTDIYVGGDFTDIGGLTANCIAKWDGNAWESISNAGENGTNSVVECMDFDYATNSVIVGGIFNSVNVLGANGAYIARFTDGSFISAVAVPSVKSATNLGLTSFSANWRPVRGASTYYLDVARDNMFTDIVGGWNNVNVGNVTTYSVNTGLSSATTYYYRVRVQTGAGISPNSNTIQLNTNNFILANIEEDYLYFYIDYPATQITNTITTGSVNPINIESATIKISNVYVSDEDVLSFTNQNGITGSWDVNTGTMTLSGVASLENYQAALRSVKYFSYCIVSDSRTISFTLYGGGYSSNTVTRIIRINYSEPPVLANIETEALSYQIGSGNAQITNTITVSDADNVNLQAALIRISGNYVNGEDELIFIDQNGISGQWEPNDGELYLWGPASITDLQTAMRSVYYKNTNNNPNTSVRTISFLVGDNVNQSNTLTRNIVLSNTVVVSPKPYIATNTGGSVKEGGFFVFNDLILSADDKDGPSYSITYVIQNGPNHGQLFNSAVTGSTSPFTFTQNDIANGKVKYLHNGGESSSDNFTFTLTDSEGNVSPVYTFNIKVTGINDPHYLTGFPKIEFPEDVPYQMPIDSLYKYLYDPENNHASFDIRVMTANDSLLCEVSGDTAWVFSGKENVFGKFKVRVTISDEEYEVDTTFYVTVVSINDMPELSNIPDKIEFMVTGSSTLNLKGCVKDVETPDSLLTYSFICEPDSINFHYNPKTCHVTLTSKNGFIGNASLCIHVEDSDSGSCDETINITVKFDPTGIEQITGIPEEYKLYQNYPNPFNPSTIIRYGIPAGDAYNVSGADVTLKVFDILGNEITTLVDGQQTPGYYEVRWNAINNASGIYFYVLQAGKFREIRKMLLVK